MSERTVERFARAVVYNQPLLLHPDKLEAILAGLEARFGLLVQARDAAPPAVRMAARDGGLLPIGTAGGTIAVLPIQGVLVKRGGGMSPDSTPLVSYEWIDTQLALLDRDPAVAGVLCHLDTPGGAAATAHDTAARIAAFSKPIWGFIDPHAYSAGAWLASACDQVWITVDGGTANIGARIVHVDETAKDAAEGRAYRIFTSGKHKALGNPHLPLTDEQAAMAQRVVDEHATRFVEAVAAYRQLDPDAVWALEGAPLSAADAKTAGLVDDFGTLESVLTAFAAHLNRPSRAAGGMGMAKDKGQEPGVGAEVIDLDTAKQRIEEARKAGADAAVKAERARTEAITRKCEAAKVPTLAAALIQSGCSVEDADARIATAQEVVAACELKGFGGHAASMLARGVTLEQAKAELFDLSTQGGGDPVRTQRPPTAPTTTNTITAVEVKAWADLRQSCIDAAHAARPAPIRIGA